MLRIDRLKKSFGARVLFSDASYHFPDGERIALVGANGAGKTSLLNILCGLDAPDDGEVLVPKQVTVGYLPQKPNPSPAATVLAECEAGASRLTALKATMDAAATALADEQGTAAEHARHVDAYERAETAYRTAGGYALTARATAILKGLGFAATDLDKDPRALSGGWRMRLELARLFLREPDFLVLDEPTNHLDLPSLVWVEAYLQSFRGTLLFVSHDRALLNRLATVTLHLASARLTPYRGNFDAFLNAREERLSQEQAERDQLRRRREQMERFVERFGAKATKAAQAQSRVKMIARIREVEDNLGTEAGEDSVFIDVPPPPKAPRIVYQIEGGTIGYERPLARAVNLTVERGAKIAIIGANGIGKSTLLRTVAGRIKPLAGAFTPGDGVAIAYFAQDQGETLEQSASVLANLLSASTLSEKEARSMLGGFLFRGTDVFKPMSVLSGGEQSRLGLACALAKKAGLLLLDEPTNHLDMASVEMLAAGIEAHTGTVLFVSHDRTFIDAVCSHVFAMLPDGRSMLFEGRLDDYARLAEVAGFPNVLRADEPPKAQSSMAPTRGAALPTTLSHEDVKDLKRQKQKLETRVETLEKEMAKLRTAIGQCDERMAALPVSDFTKSAALHAEQTATQSRLDEAETAWLEASEEVEALGAKLAAIGRA